MSLLSRTKYLAGSGKIEPLVLGQEILTMTQQSYIDFFRDRMSSWPVHSVTSSKYVYLFQLLKYWMGDAMTDTDYLIYEVRVETLDKIVHELEKLIEGQKIVELYLAVVVHPGQGVTRPDLFHLNPPKRGSSSYILKKELTETDIDDLKN